MENHKPVTFREALEKLEIPPPTGGAQYVADWRAHLPPGSGGIPGDLGQPDCSLCRGIGYVSTDVPVSHPQFGRALICDCQAEAASRREAARLQAQSALHGDELALRWRTARQTPGLLLMRDAITRALARRWGWVYIYGAVGTGKSHALRTAVAECLSQQLPAVYARWDAVLDHIRGGYSEGNYDERVDRWQSCGILALDEIGRARATDWAQEIAHKILDARYRAATYRRSVTIFSGNSAPDEFELALASRFNDGRFEIVRVDGLDLRPSQK